MAVTVSRTRLEGKAGLFRYLYISSFLTEFQQKILHLIKTALFAYLELLFSNLTDFFLLV